MRSLLVVLVAAVLVAPLSLSAEDGIDVSDRVKAFKEAMKSKDDAVKLRAVAEISATKHKDIAKALADHLKKKGSIEVKAALARALGAQGDPKHRSKLLPPRKFGQMDPVLLLAHLEGLGGMPHKDNVDPLVKMITKVMNTMKAEQQPLGIAAVGALGKIKEKNAVEELIKLLGLTNPRAGAGGTVSEDARKYRGAFRKPIVEGLTHITAGSCEDADLWAKWWKNHGGRWKVPTGTEDLNAKDVYEDPWYGFRLKRPHESWVFVRPTAEDFVIQLGHPQEGSPTTTDAYIQIQAYSTSKYSGSTPADRAAYYEQWARGDGFKDVRESSTKDVSFGGAKAKLWTCRGMDGTGTPKLARKYFMVHAGTLYSIHVNMLLSIEDEGIIKDLDKAVASFKFTD